MLKVGTLLVVLCIATSTFAQEASKKLQLEPSLKEQAMLLESSCDMNRTLLSYPETPPEDRKKYEFALNFCLWTLNYNKKAQELSKKLEAYESRISVLEAENAILKRKHEPQVVAKRELAPAAILEPVVVTDPEQKQADVVAMLTPAFGPRERVPVPRSGPARDPVTFLPLKQVKKPATRAVVPVVQHNRQSATNPSPIPARLYMN